MKNPDKEKIEQIIFSRKKAHAYFSKKSKVYQAFTDMEQKTYMDGRLSKLHKEMIAIGISIVLNCESCMEWHIKQVIDSGASVDEVLEAIEVGIEMSGGSGTVAARFALNVLDYYQQLDKVLEENK
jgi:AhpD family alkylhydroperoxidase